MSGQTLFSRLKYLTQREWLFLAKGPRYVLTSIRWNAKRRARQIGLRKQPWPASSADLWFQLDPKQTQLSEVTAALQCGDKFGAADAVVRHFRQRQSPRFFFDWNDRMPLLTLISPAEQAATIDAAEQIVQRSFCFRGQPPVTFGGSVDWTLRWPRRC